MKKQRIIFCDSSNNYHIPDFQNRIAPGGSIRSVVLCDDFLLYLNRYIEKWEKVWYDICRKFLDSKIEMYIPAGYPLNPIESTIKLSSFGERPERWKSVFLEIQNNILYENLNDHRRHLIMMFEHLIKTYISKHDAPTSSFDVFIPSDGIIKKLDAENISKNLRNLIIFEKL